MWPLIKAELSYKKYGIIFTYFVAAIFWIVYLFDPAGFFPQFFFPAIGLIYFIFMAANKEKRERFNTILPVSLKDRSIAPLLTFFVLYQFGMFSLWSVQFLIPHTDLANPLISINLLFSLNGLTIIMITFLVIHYDFTFTNKTSYRWFIKFIVLVCFLLFLSANFGPRIDPGFLSSPKNFIFEIPVGAIVINVGCIALLFIRMNSFKQRNSYFS